MAVYRPGSLIGGISGDVGGLSFANPSGSAVIRTKRRSSNVSDQRAMLRQSQLGSIAHAWQALTDAQRLAWRTYASNRTTPNRVGVHRSISGYLAFQQYRSTLALVGEPSLDNPPLVGTQHLPKNLIFTSSVSGGLAVTMDAPGVGIDLLAMIYARPLFRSTPIRFNNTWSYIGFVKESNPTSISLTTLYQSAYDLDPIEDQYVAFRWWSLSTTAQRLAIFDQIVQTSA